MIKVSCRYLSLSELPSNMDIAGYCDFVSPIDYDFGLERDDEYFVVGIIERKGTPWLYVVPRNGDLELDIAPAVLFSFDDSVISSDMVVRMLNTPQPSLEILPKNLSNIADWFERYLEGDEDVEEIITAEVNRMR